MKHGAYNTQIHEKGYQLFDIYFEDTFLNPFIGLKCLRFFLNILVYQIYLNSLNI